MRTKNSSHMSISYTKSSWNITWDGDRFTIPIGAQRLRLHLFISQTSIKVKGRGGKGSPFVRYVNTVYFIFVYL